MASFVDIQTRVKRRVIDLPTAVTTEVPALINEAMVKLQRVHNFKVMEKETAQLTTTVALRTLSTAAVPTAFKEFRLTPYLVKNTGEYKSLLFGSHKDDAQREWEVSDANVKGEPKFVLEGEVTDEAGTRNWAIYPFPDGLSDFSGGEYRVVIPYWGFLTALIADADTNWFTVNAEIYLINEAVSEAFALDWDEERMAIWAQRAATKQKEVVTTDKMKRVAGLTTLVPHFNVHGSRLRG